MMDFLLLCFSGERYDEGTPTLSSEEGVGYGSSWLLRWVPREEAVFGITWHFLAQGFVNQSQNLKTDISGHRTSIFCGALIYLGGEHQHCL